MFNEGGGNSGGADDTFSATGQSTVTQNEEIMPFETKAIFTLADFLK